MHNGVFPITDPLQAVRNNLQVGILSTLLHDKMLLPVMSFCTLGVYFRLRILVSLFERLSRVLSENNASVRRETNRTPPRMSFWWCSYKVVGSWRISSTATSYSLKKALCGPGPCNANTVQRLKSRCQLNINRSVIDINKYLFTLSSKKYE